MTASIIENTAIIRETDGTRYVTEGLISSLHTTILVKTLEDCLIVKVEGTQLKTARDMEVITDMFWLLSSAMEDGGVWRNKKPKAVPADELFM